LFALQAKADYAPYYKHSLLYLACIDPATDLTPDDRLQRAHDLGISALLGDTIYNFGELVGASLMNRMGKRVGRPVEITRLGSHKSLY
jgi:hypothetical protein